jgi:anti-sigma factor RsiW
MKPIDDETAAWLVERSLPQAPAATCPDDNILVGWSEGRLNATRAAVVAEHLTRCDDCRRVAFAWREEVRGRAADAAEAPVPIAATPTPAEPPAATKSPPPAPTATRPPEPAPAATPGPTPAPATGILTGLSAKFRRLVRRDSSK